MRMRVPRELLDAAVILVERRLRKKRSKATKEGLQRARERGVTLGRPLREGEVSRTTAWRRRVRAIKAQREVVND